MKNLKDEQIVLVKALLEKSAIDIGHSNIPEIYFKKELVFTLAEELFKSGLITFNEKSGFMPGSKIYSAEIQIILDDLEYIDLQTFINKATKDFKSVFKSLIRPGNLIDIKDIDGLPLYIGNFIKTNDNGNEIVQVILPPAEGISKTPYIGGFLYEKGDIIGFDINYVYSDTLLQPNIKKIKTII